MTPPTSPSGEELEVVTVWSSSPRIRYERDVLRFPHIVGSQRTYEVTIRYVWWGTTSLVRYRSRGCGETINVTSGVAKLGCADSREQGAALAEPAELALDTFHRGEGFEHTRVKLLSGARQACVLPTCVSNPGAATSLVATPGGQAVMITTDQSTVVESHQIVFEVRNGDFTLRTWRKGGGAFARQQIMECDLKGEVTYRNGALLFAGKPGRWQVRNEPRLNANEGTVLHVAVASGAARDEWTEIDGRYRHSSNASLQRSFDSAAPDPTDAVSSGLLWRMRRLAETGLKTTIRYLRPQGPLIEVSRTEGAVAAGVRQVSIKYRRQATASDVLTLHGEIELVAVIADAALFRPVLRSPCDDSDAVATINGYAYKYASADGELLPDAGLVMQRRVVGQLRTDRWFANLVVDEVGKAWIEDAASFFARDGLDSSVFDLLQGTSYVRDGRSARTDGDHAEVNWRSAIGVAHGRGADSIIVAHTVLPTTEIAALTAYGRGLTQAEMARSMLALGAHDAMVLDGGPSAAFSAGTIVSGGLRALPLCIAIERHFSARRVGGTHAAR